MRRRALVLGPLGVALAAAWAAWPGTAQARRHGPPAPALTPFDLARLIDAAGRQRMLTQRIVKAYCQIGLNVTPDASRRQLDEALGRFDGQLVQLTAEAPTPAVRRALAVVARQWGPFKRQAEGAVTPEGAKLLARRSEPLLAAAHAVVLALQREAGVPVARLVNVSGRQRMLSQRLAKLYMLRAYGLDDAPSHEQMVAARNDFTGALALLRAAPENTGPINTELDTVESHWAWFSQAIAMQGDASYALVVAESSEAILESMDLVTALYAGLAPR